MFDRRYLNNAMPIVAGMALAACSSDSTGPAIESGQRVTLSVATSGTASVPTGTSLGAVTVGTGGELVITKAQLVLREIELESPSLGCTSDSSSSSGSFARVSYSSGSDDDGPDDSDGSRSSDDCGEIELGPVLVDLPLAGGATEVVQVSIPEGQYHEIEFKLREPDDDASDMAFRAAHPELIGLSVKVEGTYNGQPFTWTSRMRADLEREFSPPVVVGAGAANVTLQVDVARWFRDGSGNAINPANAQGATSARMQVESNIATSFGAFQDDDRDGRSGSDSGSND